MILVGGSNRSFCAVSCRWCSWNINFSCCRGSLIKAYWRCSWLNLLCSASAPCSPWNPRPTFHLFIHSGTCRCKICIFGVMAHSGNMSRYFAKNLSVLDSARSASYEWHHLKSAYKVFMYVNLLKVAMSVSDTCSQCEYPEWHCANRENNVLKACASSSTSGKFAASATAVVTRLTVMISMFSGYGSKIMVVFIQSKFWWYMHNCLEQCINLPASTCAHDSQQKPLRGTPDDLRGI